MPDYRQRNTTQNSNPSSETQTASAADHEEQQLVGNQAIAEIISAQNSPTGERELNPNKNGIVYLGLNHYAHDEARKLNQINRGNTQTTSHATKHKLA